MQRRKKASLAALAAFLVAPLVLGFASEATADAPLRPGELRVTGRNVEVGGLSSPARDLSRRGPAKRDYNREVALALAESEARKAGSATEIAPSEAPARVANAAQAAPAPYVYEYDDSTAQEEDVVFGSGTFDEPMAYAAPPLLGASVRLLPDANAPGGVSFELALPMSEEWMRETADSEADGQ